MIKKIFLNILSLLNLVYLNLRFIILRLSGKKVITFYFGAIGSFKNHNLLISEIIKKNKNKNIILFKISEIFKKKFFFNYINMRFIRYLNFTNTILTNTVDRNLPKKTINILIPHDFYDTFSTFSNFEKKDFIKNLKLMNYDYIFCPNNVVKKFYKNKLLILKRKFHASKNMKLTKLLIVGYFKYDYVQKLIKEQKIKNSKNILILGTSFGAYSKLQTISKLLEKLLVDFSNYNLTFRPHPKENKKLINKIKKKFINNKKIRIDLSPMYIRSFNESEFAIADYTGSAYSYSLLTQKPIIFFFDRKLKNSEKKTRFYKDIKNIGILAKSIPEIKKKHIILATRKKMFTKKISMFKNKIFPENNNFIKNFYSFFNKKFF